MASSEKKKKTPERNGGWLALRTHPPVSTPMGNSSAAAPVLFLLRMWNWLLDIGSATAFSISAVDVAVAVAVAVAVTVLLLFSLHLTVPTVFVSTSHRASGRLVTHPMTVVLWRNMRVCSLTCIHPIALGLGVMVVVIVVVVIASRMVVVVVVIMPRATSRSVLSRGCLRSLRKPLKNGAEGGPAGVVLVQQHTHQATQAPRVVVWQGIILAGVNGFCQRNQARSFERRVQSSKLVPVRQCGRGSG